MTGRPMAVAGTPLTDVGQSGVICVGLQLLAVGGRCWRATLPPDCVRITSKPRQHAPHGGLLFVRGNAGPSEPSTGYHRNDSQSPALSPAVREGSRMELQLRLPGDWPVGQHRHAPPEPAGEDLKSVLVWLQEVEINV